MINTRKFLFSIALLFSILLMGNIISFAKEFVCGYSGGRGGTEFTDAVPNNSRVLKVKVRAGRLIDAIQMVHYTEDGEYPLDKHGGSGGTEYVFELGHGEYIQEIGGRFGSKVDCIYIKTNKRTKQYGGEGGDADYVYQAPEGYEIAGFCGRSGRLVDAIGVIFRER